MRIASLIARYLAGVIFLVINPINQEVASAMLRSFGLTVVTAADGRAAVEAVQTRKFDLDGLPDARDGRIPGSRYHIRRLASDHNRVPIIALTANALQGDEERCMSCGMNDFLAEPFTSEQLRSSLGRWLPTLRREMSQELPTATSRSARGQDHDEAVNQRTLEGMQGLDPSGGAELLKRVVRLYFESARLYLDRIERALRGGKFSAVATGGACDQVGRSQCRRRNIIEFVSTAGATGTRGAPRGCSCSIATNSARALARDDTDGRDFAGGSVIAMRKRILVVDDELTAQALNQRRSNRPGMRSSRPATESTRCNSFAVATSTW